MGLSLEISVVFSCCIYCLKLLFSCDKYCTLNLTSIKSEKRCGPLCPRSAGAAERHSQRYHRSTNVVFEPAPEVIPPLYLYITFAAAAAGCSLEIYTGDLRRPLPERKNEA